MGIRCGYSSPHSWLLLVLICPREWSLGVFPCTVRNKKENLGITTEDHVVLCSHIRAGVEWGVFQDVSVSPLSIWWIRRHKHPCDEVNDYDCNTLNHLSLTLDWPGRWLWPGSANFVLPQQCVNADLVGKVCRLINNVWAGKSPKERGTENWATTLSGVTQVPGHSWPLACFLNHSCWSGYSFIWLIKYLVG